MDSSYCAIAPYPTADVEAMARALWNPSEPVFYLDRDNKKHGYAASLQEAVRDGRPFVVRPRLDVLVSDDDSDKELAAAFAEEFLADFEPVVEWTGQGRRQRCLVVVDDPGHRAWLLNAAKEFGIGDSAYGRRVRPPGAPHRFGGFSRLYGDMTPAEVIRRLHRPYRPVGLGYLASRALYEGVPADDSDQSRDRSASAVLWAATLGMVNAGYDEDTMWSLLMKHRGGEKVQRLAAGEAEARSRSWWTRYVLRRARDRVAASPSVSSAEEAQEFIDRLQRWMNVHRWKGRGGANQKAALGIMLQTASRLNSTFDIGMSERQLAELAGFTDRTTARSALLRLIELGALERTHDQYRTRDAGSSGARARSYTLRQPRPMTPEEHDAWYRPSAAGDDQSSLLHQSEPGGVRVNGEVATFTTAVGHDAFRARGIGKSKLFVWNALDAVEPRTAKQIAVALKYKTPDTPRRHLHALEHAGLAQRVDGGWLRLEPDLDQIAIQLGTAGDGDALRNRHLIERERNARKLTVVPETEFVKRRLRRGSRSDTLDHREVRVEFYTFCDQERDRTKIKHHTPGPNNRLVVEILTQIPGARFESTNGKNWPPSGRWHGLQMRSGDAS